MADTMDTFTVLDRRELMKLGIQLEHIASELGEVKLAAKDEVQRNTTAIVAQDLRIRSLEESRTVLEAQAKTSLWWMMLFAGVVSSGVSLVLRWFGK